MGGRPPKTTAQHKADGTYREDRHGKEPEFESSVDLKVPPEGLKVAEKKVWIAEASALVDARVLTHADVPMFTMYCKAVVMLDKAIKKLGNDFVIDTYRGPAKNPQWNVVNELMTQVNNMRKEFGMSPVSRTKVKVDKSKKKENPFSDLLTPSAVN